MNTAPSPGRQSLAQKFDEPLRLRWQQPRLGDRIHRHRLAMPVSEDTGQCVLLQLVCHDRLRHQNNALVEDGRGRGGIVFIGATASRRGGVKTAAFAPANVAQRSLAESMAKTLWPIGMHVDVVIVDGAVDLPTSRKLMPDRTSEAFIAPAPLAETVHVLMQQDRQGWRFEVEVGPFAESW